MQCFIVALYYDTTMPDYPWPSNIPLTERNQAIIEAYQRGETLEHMPPHLRSQLLAYTRFSSIEVS